MMDTLNLKMIEFLKYNYCGELMKQINFQSVKPGDILFTARPGKLSKSIRFASGGTVSHAIICVQHGSFIDSTMDGVQARNFQRELFEDNEKIYHFRLKEPVGRETLAKIIDFARAEVGTRYSIREAVRSVAATAKPRTKQQFCSRLVAKAYKHAGINLVSDADYCSPEELKNSPLLNEIPIETIEVSEDQLRFLSEAKDPIKETHEAQNAVLEVARSFDTEIESFEEIFPRLVARADLDEAIAEALVDSGYLDLWRTEIKTHPWRYDQNLIDRMTAPEEMRAIRKYCIGTVQEAYSGGFRFVNNLVALRHLNEQFPRRSFELEIELYEILVQNDQDRREIAYQWLLKHHPNDLKQHMEQIEPHSNHWYFFVGKVEPAISKMTQHAIAAEGKSDICFVCGDQPSKAYRLVNGTSASLGIPSLRLCEDCIKIRRTMGAVLLPFLNR